MEEPPVLTELSVLGPIVRLRALPPRVVHAAEVVALTLAVVACAGLGAGYGAGGWVACICLGCVLAFRGAMWLIVRRAKYEVVLDFDLEIVQLVDVRGFDPPKSASHGFEFIERIEVRESGAEVVAGLVWAGEEGPAVWTRLPRDHPDVGAFLRLVQSSGL